MLRDKLLTWVIPVLSFLVYVIAYSHTLKTPINEIAHALASIGFATLWAIFLFLLWIVGFVLNRKSKEGRYKFAGLIFLIPALWLGGQYAMFQFFYDEIVRLHPAWTTDRTVSMSNDLFNLLLVVTATTIVGLICLSSARYARKLNS